MSAAVLLGELTNEELLRLALEATGAERGAEAMALLKALIERDPSSAHAHHLLGASYAAIGMWEEAEDSLASAVRLDPAAPVPAIQLGLLQISVGRGEAAGRTVAPLAASTQDAALVCFARAIGCLAGDDARGASTAIARGLALPQENPALAEDFKRLLGALEAAPALPLAGTDEASEALAPVEPAGLGNFLLTGYRSQGGA